MRINFQNNFYILVFTAFTIFSCNETKINHDLFDKITISTIDSLNQLALDLTAINLLNADSIAHQALYNSELINYDKGIAESNRILGFINKERGNYQESFDLLQNSLTINEEIKFAEGIAKTNNNLGILFKTLGFLDEALDYYRAANNTKYIKTDSTLLAIVNTNIANVKVAQEKYEEAITLYTSYLPFFEQLQDTAKIMAIYINFGEAESKRDAGNSDEALSLFKKSEKLAERSRDSLFIMLSNKYIGNLLLKSNQLEEAYPRLMLAYDLAEKLKRPQNIYTIASYLKTYYDSLNNEESFKYYQNIMDDIETELNKDESSKAISTIIKNKKDQIDNKKFRNQKRLIFISLSVLIVLIILIFSLYRNYQHKQRANKLLTEMDELKTRLYSNITHELRTPLTLILGPLEQMLSSETEKKPTRKQVKMMRKNANSLLNLVNQMLDLSKIDANSIKLELVEEDINKFLRRHFTAFASAAEQKSINFSVSRLKEKNIRVFDSSKLEKIVNNLVSNAIKYTPKNGEVKCIANFPKANLLEMIIEDTGIGIHPEEIEKIFDRYHQIKSADTFNTVGTGIGLSLTKELVQLMYGKIEVKSEANFGTKFIVTIPLGTEHLKSEEYNLLQSFSNAEKPTDILAEEDDVQDSNNDIMSNSLNQDKPQVLIVEDHKEIRDYIADSLNESFLICTASNGNEGLKIAIEQIPDLIITDVVMKEMDGIELCKQIKTDEKTSHIPVIILTGKTSIEDKIKGIETGADAYLTKPFNVKELHLRVQKLIEQRQKLRERFARDLKLEPKDIAVTSVDEKFLNRAMEIIEKNIGNAEFEVRQFQEEMFMSRMQLFRKIKALTNQTPGEFIRTIRLKRAASLIKQNFGNIAQITFEVGFNNPSYFAKCFKDLYGKLPSEFMKDTNQD